MGTHDASQNTPGQIGRLLLQNHVTMVPLGGGAIGLDGTKIHANASRYSTLSHGHAQQIEAHLAAIRQAKAQVEARAAGRDALEQEKERNNHEFCR